MNTRSNLIFVDCEAQFGKPTPFSGRMTAIGAVPFPDYDAHSFLHVFAHVHSPWPQFEFELATVASAFHSWLRRMVPRGRVIMVSDNPAYDWQWVAHMFDVAGRPNPFGHSARRIGDFWAGMHYNFRDSVRWKKLRRTPHDHNPVNDARGNAEAFEAMLIRKP